MKNQTQEKCRQVAGSSRVGTTESGSRWQPLVVSCALVAMVVLSGSIGGVGGSEMPDDGDIVESRVVVTFHDGVPEQMPDYVGALGGEAVLTVPELSFVVISIDPDNSADLIRAALADPSVSAAEYDRYVHAAFYPNDILWPQQWGGWAIGLMDAWDKTLGSHDVDIHVLDTGVDYTHADLVNNLVCGLPGADFVSNPLGLGLGAESGFHGTHVAGIAGAEINNRLGVAGASQSCITSVRVLAAQAGLMTWLAAGIIWSTNNGAEIISMSLGGSSGPSYLTSAVNYADANGVLMIAAAGNDGCVSGSGNVGFPAKYSKVVAVAALQTAGTRAGYSSCGPEVEISAPGSNIWSTLPGNLYGPLSGTSMATPLVSGVAGLMYDYADMMGSPLNSADARCILSATAVFLGPANQFGAGRIDANDAVMAAPNPSSVGC